MLVRAVIREPINIATGRCKVMAIETRKQFTVAEYYKMAEAGILTEDDRVELIRGEIVEMSPIGSRHAGCVMRLITLLTEEVRRAAIVNAQNPVRLDDYSEPQPDIMLLAPREDFYSQSHPTPSDVLLVIEVADTSIGYDRRDKLPLYAEFGIGDVWLVNLNNEVVEVYGDPAAGKYQSVAEARRGETIALPGFEGTHFSVDDMLGPAGS
jgi:Uma2 family endonuclease